MKYFLALFSLLFAMSAHAETKCELTLKPVGIYYYSCPKGSLADGVDAFHPGPSPYPTVRVRCVQPVVECKDVEKEVVDEDI